MLVEEGEGIEEEEAEMCVGFDLLLIDGLVEPPPDPPPPVGASLRLELAATVLDRIHFSMRVAIIKWFTQRVTLYTVSKV